MPFLSTTVAEFVLGLPQKVAQRRRRPKALIQDAFKGLLPESVVRRKKVPFQMGLGLTRHVSRSLPDAPDVLLEWYYAEYPKLRAGAAASYDVERGVGEGVAFETTTRTV